MLQTHLESSGSLRVMTRTGNVGTVYVLREVEHSNLCLDFWLYPLQTLGEESKTNKASRINLNVTVTGLVQILTHTQLYMITTGADALPFPYVKGIFGTVVFLLEAVQKVKQNQESMKELCGDTVDIIMVLRDQISAHGDTAALKFKTQCEELEVFLQDVLETVNQLGMRPRGFGARFKEVIKASSTVDEISRFRTRMWELRTAALASNLGRSPREYAQSIRIANTQLTVSSGFLYDTENCFAQSIRISSAQLTASSDLRPNLQYGFLVDKIPGNCRLRIQNYRFNIISSFSPSPRENIQ
ncbi:hypothetical protein C8R44DRAFT_747345 [Mycena epipterygia]|nr:hypothetical protein C8R44DRAFT_747345 [Mycena epipterygia]